MAAGGRVAAPAPAQGTPHRLRRDWPFRRVALVLAGGGSRGAYEVGVLRVLEAIGLAPAIVSGVSVGALNAVAWIGHGYRTDRLEQAWRSLRGSQIGMRWMPLTLRAAGGVLVVVSFLQVVLAIAGWPAFHWSSRIQPLRRFETESLVLECLAWTVVAILGLVMVRISPTFEDVIAHVTTDPRLVQRVVLGVLAVGGILYVVVVLAGIPWPRRFHATVLLGISLGWLLSQPNRVRNMFRDVLLGLLPETRGRGLWRASARRRLIESLLAGGDPRRLEGEPHLVVSACDLDTGRMHHFVNWRDPEPRFCHAVRVALGEVVPISGREELIDAAVASSAVPFLFEPARFRGHDYVDAGYFTNQPLHLVVADGVDAILLVLVSPSSGPGHPETPGNVVELGARLQELGNWRDLQTELRLLPPTFNRDGAPARVCVVEPDQLLPGAMFTFDPANADELIARGVEDAWRALERSGWLEDAGGGPVGVGGAPPLPVASRATRRRLG